MGIKTIYRPPIKKEGHPETGWPSQLVIKFNPIESMSPIQEPIFPVPCDLGR